jgi:hypothetical protein
MTHGLVLVGALLLGLQGEAQTTMPVFHAEAYVVTTLVTFSNGHGVPSRGLTSENFQVSVNKTPIAMSVSEDPQEPGAYVLSINPPLALRDGKSHHIDIKVRNWGKTDGKWHDLPLKWAAVFEKPHNEPATGRERRDSGASTQG